MPRRISEEQTRKEMIDPQLEKAGRYLCDHSKVKIEIPVDGYDAEHWNGVTDNCLYRENGEVLAVVQAKRTSTDVRLTEAQLTMPTRSASCAPCKACSYKSAISKLPPCTSHRWICSARMWWSAGLRRWK